MLWKMIMFHLIAMPVIMLAYFMVVLSFPQIGLFNGPGLAWGAAVSFVVAFPAAWFLSKKMTDLVK